MKRLLIFGLTLFALSGCKQNPATPTPVTTTTSYAGEYNLTGTEIFTTNGQKQASNLKATLFVFATSNPNSYYFLERYGATETSYFVTLNGTSFDLELHTEQVYIDFNRWIGNWKGSGKFDGKNIILSRETSAFNLWIGNALTPYPTNVRTMSRSTSIVATPK